MQFIDNARCCYFEKLTKIPLPQLLNKVNAGTNKLQ